MIHLFNAITKDPYAYRLNFYEIVFPKKIYDRLYKSPNDVKWCIGYTIIDLILPKTIKYTTINNRIFTKTIFYENWIK